MNLTTREVVSYSMLDVLVRNIIQNIAKIGKNISVHAILGLFCNWEVRSQTNKMVLEQESKKLEVSNFFKWK